MPHRAELALTCKYSSLLPTSTASFSLRTTAISMDTLPVLQPILHNPGVAPALNTSPEALGFTDSPVVPRESKDSSSSSRVKRLSSAMEKTVDKLGRSISGKSSASPSAGGHRRLFSISRKGKATDHSDGTSLPVAWLLSNSTPRL